MIEIGGAPAVLPPAGLQTNPAGTLKVPRGPLDRGAGEVQVRADHADKRPADALLVRPALEVHIHGPVPVEEVRSVN